MGNTSSKPSTTQTNGAYFDGNLEDELLYSPVDDIQDQNNKEEEETTDSSDYSSQTSTQEPDANAITLHLTDINTEIDEALMSLPENSPLKEQYGIWRENTHPNDIINDNEEDKIAALKSAKNIAISQHKGKNSSARKKINAVCNKENVSAEEIIGAVVSIIDKKGCMYGGEKIDAACFINLYLNALLNISDIGYRLHRDIVLRWNPDMENAIKGTDSYPNKIGHKSHPLLRWRTTLQLSVYFNMRDNTIFTTSSNTEEWRTLSNEDAALIHSRGLWHNLCRWNPCCFSNDVTSYEPPAETNERKTTLVLYFLPDMESSKSQRETQLSRHNIEFTNNIENTYYPNTHTAYPILPTLEEEQGCYVLEISVDELESYLDTDRPTYFMDIIQKKQVAYIHPNRSITDNKDSNNFLSPGEITETYEEQKHQLI